MKNSLIIKNLMLRSGFMSLCRRLQSQGAVSILRYHAIVSPEHNFYASPSICLREDLFEAQVRFLSQHYNVIDLDQVADALENKRPFPERAIVLTFDDGYQDNYPAHQILKQYGVTGTFYIAAGCVGEGEPLWLFEVIYLIQKTKKTVFSLEVDGQSQTFSLKTAAEKLNAARKITALIKSNNLAVREAIRKTMRSTLHDVADLDEKSKKVMLSWDQVREMHANGMTIASHTMTHINLPNANPEDAQNEIIDCKSLLEQQLGALVNHFSYPNGGNYDYYNDRIKKMVIDANYRTSTTSNNGIVRPNADSFELRRIRVTDHLAEIIYQMDVERLITS